MTDTAVQRGLLRNALGEVVPVVTDDEGVIRAAAPNGRLIVAPGQTIASAWGNTTYDQTVQTYANAADRTNQWPAPNEGAVSWLMDSHSPWIYRGGAWRGLPMGVLSQATTVTGSTATSTNADWFTAPAFTADGVRRVKVTYSGMLNGGAANDLSNLRLMEGSTVLNLVQVRHTAAGGLGQLTVQGVFHLVPTAGSHTYKLNVAMVNGTSAAAVANATNPGSLLIEDIGT